MADRKSAPPHENPPANDSHNYETPDFVRRRTPVRSSAMPTTYLGVAREPDCRAAPSTAPLYAAQFPSLRSHHCPQLGAGDFSVRRLREFSDHSDRSTGPLRRQRMSNIFDDTTLIAGRNHEKHDSLTRFRMLH